MDKEEVIQDMQQPTVKETWEMMSALNREHAPLPDMPAEWEKLSNRLGFDIESEKEALVSDIDNKPHKVIYIKQNPAKFLYFLSGVAATIAAFFLFNLFTQKEQSTKDDYFFAANNERQEITITSDNDKPKVVNNQTLNFDNNESEPATPSRKGKSEKILTLTTPRGKDYMVTLSDGTKVWMNAESKLQFPEVFQGKTREVFLHGEAYFEVAKDATRPFIVKTNYFNTKVLGTTFNVKAYSGKDANIVLIEGSVAVMQKNKKKETILQPGQQFTITDKQSLVREVDTYPYTQWREGFFYFENQTLFEIMQELGRWYNVNIAFDDPDKMNIRVHFVYNRSHSLINAIKNMNALGIHVEYNNNVITIF